MKGHKTWNGQLNVEGEQSRKTGITWLQDLLEKLHPESMGLANRQIDEGAKQSPEVGPHKYGKLVFDKETKAIQWSEDSFIDKPY